MDLASMILSFVTEILGKEKELRDLIERMKYSILKAEWIIHRVEN